MCKTGGNGNWEAEGTHRNSDGGGRGKKPIASLFGEKHGIAKSLKHGQTRTKPMKTATYITLKNNPIQHTDNDIAKCTDMLLKQSKKLFIEGKVDQDQLAKALNKANLFIDDPGKKEINSYGQFVKKAMKNHIQNYFVPVTPSDQSGLMRKSVFKNCVELAIRFSTFSTCMF